MDGIMYKSMGIETICNAGRGTGNVKIYTVLCGAWL